MTMSVLNNIPLDLDIFYKKSDIPEIALGDKVKVVIYLELPKATAEGDKKEKIRLLNILKSSSLSMQEGGRVLNLGDNTDKVKSMNQVLKIYKKVESKIKVIAVGDNFNDLDMLRNCDIPCLVFNDQFKQDQINIDNLIVSNKPSPEGWADVIKTALVKLDY